MLRISNIKLEIKKDRSALKKEVLNKLNIIDESLISYKVVKQSIDARKKNDICFVYTVDAEVIDEKKVLQGLKNKSITVAPKSSYEYVEKGTQNLNKRPVIVGTGPSGLFAGLILSQMGYNPILLERGKSVEGRSIDVERFWETGQLNLESNVQFGEGGAGTFSDGKLNTLTKDPRGSKVLEEFVAAGGPKDILYVNKPHIGTDILRDVVVNIRNTIISLGGEVRFESKVTDVLIEGEELKGVIINGKEQINTDILVLAVGHSARDTFEMLYDKGINMIQKAFSIGVRIEHPQELIDKSQYGNFAGNPKLGAADYKLSGHFGNGRSAYTFCMCPGGEVVGAASEENRLVTNGMSYHARDKENANSGLLINISPEDFESEHPLAGISFQRKWEELAFKSGGGNYNAPAQLVGDFLNDIPSTEFKSVKPSYTPGYKLTDLRECLPDYVVETLKKAIPEFNKRLKGFSHPDAIMTGVETRSSSPVRIPRDENYQANIKGIYPVGEGAGYAGGIISAAVDGIRIAEEIAKR